MLQVRPDAFLHVSKLHAVVVKILELGIDTKGDSFRESFVLSLESDLVFHSAI